MRTAPLRRLYATILAICTTTGFAIPQTATALATVTKCGPDRVSDNLGVVKVERRLRVVGKTTEEELRASLLAEYDAIKEMVKRNPHPSKVYMYAFDDCSREPDMWLAMLAQNLNESTPTIHINASMLKAPTSTIDDTQIVGRWIHAHPSIGRVVTIYRKAGEPWVEASYVDGSRSDKQLVPQEVGGERRLVLPGNKSGEYFVISPDGLLKEYDSDGLIYTLPKHTP